MATKKDLAFEHFMRMSNPAPKKKATAKRKSKALSAKSQITGKPPTKRLVKRRAKNTEPGYFPNPSHSSDIKLSDIEQLKYFVQEKTPSGWLATGAFHELEDAKEYATLMAESGNTTIRVVE